LTGRILLADALLRAASSEIASFAIIVDAKNEEARSFCERESFLPFPDHPYRCFARWPILSGCSSEHRRLPSDMRLSSIRAVLHFCVSFQRCTPPHR